MNNIKNKKIASVLVVFSLILTSAIIPISQIDALEKTPRVLQSNKIITPQNSNYAQGLDENPEAHGIDPGNIVQSVCSFATCSFIMEDGSIQGFNTSRKSQHYFPGTSTEKSGWADSNTSIPGRNMDNGATGRKIYDPPTPEENAISGYCAEYSCSFIMADGSIQGFNLDSTTAYFYPNIPAEMTGWAAEGTAVPGSDTNFGTIGRKIYDPSSENGKAISGACTAAFCTFIMADGSIQGFNTRISVQYYYPGTPEIKTGWSGANTAISGSETTKGTTGHKIYDPPSVDQKAVSGACSAEICTYIMANGSIQGFFSYRYSNFKFPATPAEKTGWAGDSTSILATDSDFGNIGRKIYDPAAQGDKAIYADCARFSCSFVMADGSIQGFNTAAINVYSFPGIPESKGGWAGDGTSILGNNAAKGTTGRKIYDPISDDEKPISIVCAVESCTFIMKNGSIQGFNALKNNQYSYPGTPEPGAGWAAEGTFIRGTDSNKGTIGRKIYDPSTAGVKAQFGACSWAACSFIMADGTIQGFLTALSVSIYYPGIPEKGQGWASDGTALHGGLPNTPGGIARTIYDPPSGVVPISGVCSNWSCYFNMSDITIQGFHSGPETHFFIPATPGENEFWAGDGTSIQGSNLQIGKTGRVIYRNYLWKPPVIPDPDPEPSPSQIPEDEIPSLDPSLDPNLPSPIPEAEGEVMIEPSGENQITVKWIGEKNSKVEYDNILHDVKNYKSITRSPVFGSKNHWSQKFLNLPTGSYRATIENENQKITSDWYRKDLHIEKPYEFTDLEKVTKEREADIDWLTKVRVTFGAGCDAKGSGKKCKYLPQKPVNRGAMAQFLRNLLGNPNSTQKTPKIQDISKLGSAIGSRGDDIRWLAAEGITVIGKNLKYNPEKPVYRGEMAQFLWKLAGSPAYNETDLDKVAKKAKLQNDKELTKLKKSNRNRYYNILWLAKMNITYIDPAVGRFNPKNVVNRGAMAQFMHKLYYVMITGKPVPTSGIVPDPIQ